MCLLIIMPFGVFPIFAVFFYMYLGCEKSLVPASLLGAGNAAVLGAGHACPPGSRPRSRVPRTACRAPSCREAAGDVVVLVDNPAVLRQERSVPGVRDFQSSAEVN